MSFTDNIVTLCHLQAIGYKNLQSTNVRVGYLVYGKQTNQIDYKQGIGLQFM